MTTHKAASGFACAECGWFSDGAAYHPYIACLIVKGSGKNPLPYLWDVVTFYLDHPEELPGPIQERLATQ